MMKKSFITISALLMVIFTSAYKRPDVYTIDAQKNAVLHNNLGLEAVANENYVTAIEEFNIAIALNPRTQATAVYYNNLGETYYKIGYYKEAQQCFQNSITLFDLNFLYYQNLVKTFKQRGLVKSKINYYKVQAEKHSLDMLMLGLLYIENNDIRSGVIKLDEFCMQEPNLIITNSVRAYLKQVVPK